MSVNEYDIGPLLGNGGFALVHSARHRWSGERVALKVIEIGSLNETEVKRVHREVDVHATISKHKHNNIVRLIDHFEDEARVYLVLEYCANADLYKLLRSNGPFQEHQARDTITQLLHGLSFLHSHNVVHRDLKLSNMLLCENGCLKIADFGLATRLLLPTEEHFTLCGTPNYIAPEVVDASGGHAHGLPADLFSVGCLLHMLLTATPPFPNQIQKEDCCPHIVPSTSWNPPFDSPLSAHAMDFLMKLLCVDPGQRISAQEALLHPFLNPSTSSLNLSLTVPKDGTPKSPHQERARMKNTIDPTSTQANHKQDDQHTPQQQCHQFQFQHAHKQKVVEGENTEITASTMAAPGGDVSLTSRTSAATLPRFRPVPRRVIPPKIPNRSSDIESPPLILNQTQTLSKAKSQTSGHHPPLIENKRAVQQCGSRGGFEPVREKEMTPSPPIPTPPPDANLRQSLLPQHPLPWEKRQKAPPIVASINNSRRVPSTPSIFSSPPVTPTTTPGDGTSSEDVVSALVSGDHVKNRIFSPKEKGCSQDRRRRRVADQCPTSISSQGPILEPKLSSCHDIAIDTQRPRPLDTRRLRPFVHISSEKCHSFCVEEDGRALLWLKNGLLPKSHSQSRDNATDGILEVPGSTVQSRTVQRSADAGSWMGVSSDGQDVAIGALVCPFQTLASFHNALPEVVTQFRLLDLPTSLWPKYRFLKECVRVLRSQTPKVELYLYSESGYNEAQRNSPHVRDQAVVKFTLMENGPLADFIGKWGDGSYLRYKLGQHGGTSLEVRLASGKFKWSSPRQRNKSLSSSSSFHQNSRNVLQWPRSVPEFVADHLSVTQRALQFCLNVEHGAVRCACDFPIAVHQSYGVVTGPDSHQVAVAVGTNIQAELKTNTIQREGRLSSFSESNRCLSNHQRHCAHVLQDSESTSCVQMAGEEEGQRVGGVAASTLDDYLFKSVPARQCSAELDLSSIGTSSPPPGESIL